ncbi:hypothetical protein F4775DRAFT_590273 [Biscogniauxia sp. FL1348]|nr:hypothetical protein F4775DRAFT_590273 [Biscogniauxia sp. FL1348]
MPSRPEKPTRSRPPPPSPSPRQQAKRGPPPPPRPRPRPRPGPAARGAGLSSEAAALGGSISGLTLKRMIWTGAFAAVGVVGAVYGAGLKTQQEYQAEKKHIAELSIEDRIRDLEGRRAELVAQRWPIERKIDELRARMRRDGSGSGSGDDSS